MKKDSPNIIAFYLPQYHPIKENNEWYGEGFTEWTNVAKAKPLFKGHYQPIIPADLGFYDLRIPEVREAQVRLAREAGVSAFCYYHYWFGGKQIMQDILEDVVRTGKPDFPFCICWANLSWYKKEWNPDTKSLREQIIMEQTYPGDSDIIAHFNYLLPFFKDKRYLRIDNKPLFFIYQVQFLPDFLHFKEMWEKLAEKNGLPGFYYLTYTTSIDEVHSEKLNQCDGIVLSLINNAINKGRKNRYINFIKSKFKSAFNIIQGKVEYSTILDYLLDDVCKEEKIIPVIVPNWDHTARRGRSATLFHNSTPKLFKKHVLRALNIIKDKPNSHQIIFLKSWNEWAEGNYMEPDLIHGKGYIKALKEAIEEYKKD